MQTSKIRLTCVLTASGELLSHFVRKKGAKKEKIFVCLSFTVRKAQIKPNGLFMFLSVSYSEAH